MRKGFIGYAKCNLRLQGNFSSVCSPIGQFSRGSIEQTMTFRFS